MAGDSASAVLPISTAQSVPVPAGPPISDAQSAPGVPPISKTQSAPAVLPISTAQSAATDNQQSALASSTSPARAMLHNISDNVRSSLVNRRPWPEFYDLHAFSKPGSLSEVALRFRKNYNYFRVNYLIGVTAVLGVSLLTNPLSLELLSLLLAAWCFIYLFRQSSDPPLTAFGRVFSDRETLLCLIVSTAVVFFLTSVGSVLVSALMFGAALICLHGAFRTPEYLFNDVKEPQGGSGYNSFVTDGPPAPQPPVGAKA